MRLAKVQHGHVLTMAVDKMGIESIRNGCRLSGVKSTSCCLSDSTSTRGITRPPGVLFECSPEKCICLTENAKTRTRVSVCKPTNADSHKNELYRFFLHIN